jgi:rubredoxin
MSGINGQQFEGSYLGDRRRLPPAARLECKICWWVYDPIEGDAQWQIEPGTPFAELPIHWRCPQCDGTAEQFLVIA